MRLWSGSFMVHLRLNFPLHLHALRTQDDITFASPLHSVHMKNKIRAVTWSFIQSIYQRRFYIFTLFYPSPTHSYIIHIRFCFTSHIFFTAFTLVLWATFYFLLFLDLLIHHYIFLLFIFITFYFLLFLDFLIRHYIFLHWDYMFIHIFQTNETKNLTLSVLDGWW